MAHRFAEIAFTDTVKDVQSSMGSRERYRQFEEVEDMNFLLTEREASFIELRDSFYLASVNEDGWPYVQHRGGPAGFVKVLDERTIGFADFRGNRQYVTTGNIRGDNRVSIIMMDYPNRRRLKLFGRVAEIANHELEQLAQLEVPGYRAVVERGFIIQIEGYDWNCPQHITPRFTLKEIEEANFPAGKPPVR